MSQTILAPIAETAIHNFSSELINEFNQHSAIKITRHSDEQTDEQIWIILPVSVKVKYITYLSFKKSGDRSQDDMAQLFNILSWSATEIENKWDQIAPSVLNYIEIALQLRSTLIFLPELNLLASFTACNTLDMLAEQRVTPNRAKLYALSQTLDQWVDWTKIKVNPPSASEAVLAVLQHYEPDFTLAELMLMYDSQYQVRLDEAVLLYTLSHNEESLSNIVLPLLRSEFIELLKKEEEDKKILDQLFFNKSDGTDAIIFDGFVFKNALGKSFSDMLNCTELNTNAAFSALSETEKHRLMNKKFSTIGESTKYVIGTVQHSLASSIMRIKQHQNKLLTESWPDDLTLLKEFKKLIEEWSENKNYPFHPFLLFALHLTQSSGINSKQTTETLLKNAGERLYANYGPVAAFSLRAATTEILSEYGISQAQMEQLHDYIIVRQHLLLLPSPQVNVGNFYQEFWERGRRENEWLNRYIILNSNLINVPAELHKKWRAFTENLPQHPWIQAKAKDNLIMAKKMLSTEAISQEVGKLINQCQANQCRLNIEPAAQFPVGEIFEELINMIPFVGSLYNIEEGIRHHDWVQAVLGTISLGVDGAGLIYSGLKSGVSDAKTSMNSLAKNDQKVIKALEQAVEQTTDLPITHWTNNLDAITIDTDPYNLKLPDAHVPLEFREQAALVRAGAKDKQWKSYTVVYVIDQDRVVPIKSSGGGFFYEVDWQTEQPNYAKLIMCEPGEKYYTKVGLKGGGRAESGKYNGTPKNRNQIKFLDAWANNFTTDPTCSALSNFFPKAANTEILPEFNTRFIGKFDLALEKGQSPAITIHTYSNLYQRSPTFRRLFNYAIEIPGDKFRIKITETDCPQVNFNKKQIKLPGEGTLSLVPQYIDLTGEMVDFSPERIYLHEILHVLSAMGDPLSGVSSIFNRGPIVYLTERILFEAGHVSPGRLCYQVEFGDTAVRLQTSMEDGGAISLEDSQSTGFDFSDNEFSSTILSNNLPWYTDDTAITAAGDSRQGSLISSNYVSASANSSAPIQLSKLLARQYLPPKPLRLATIRNLMIKKTIAEDMAFDLVLAKDVEEPILKPTADTLILSKKISEYNTVMNVIKYKNCLKGRFKSWKPGNSADFHHLFHSNLADLSNMSESNLFKISRNCLLCAPLTGTEKIKNILENCYLSSPTFRKLLMYKKFELSSAALEKKWNFILYNEYDKYYLSNNAFCFKIKNESHNIIFRNYKAFAYLSDTGIQRLSLPRQSISAMVSIFLDDTRFPLSELDATDVERGISVYLSNQIMDEAGYQEPAQLTRDLLPLYVLTGDKGERLLVNMQSYWKENSQTMIASIEKQMLEQQNILLSKTTNARRVSEIQDEYLATLETD